MRSPTKHNGIVSVRLTHTQRQTQRYTFCDRVIDSVIGMASERERKREK